MTLPEDGAPAATPDPQAQAGSPDPAPEPNRDSARDTTPAALQREPLHFIVVVLLIGDIVFGLALAVFAEKVLNFRPMAIMGCGLAALGLGVLGYFVLAGGGRDSRW